MILALVSGVMTLISGIKVLAGISHPDQLVLNWLVVYNVILALVSIAEAHFILRQYPGYGFLAGMILLSHSAILIVLTVIYFTSTQVAVKSIGAMCFRVLIWTIILIIARNVCDTAFAKGSNFKT